jgi:RNA polymerase-binding protein DksA
MTRKKAAVRKTAAAKKKAATRKKTARKSTARKTATRKKPAKKTAKAARKKATKTTRKPAARVKSKTSKPSKAARKTTRKSARKPGANTAPAVAVPTLPAELAPSAARAKRPVKLNKKDLDLFRELLLAKRAQLVGDVSTLQSQALSANRQDAAGDLSSMPIHMADLGSDNYEKEFTLGLIESERTLLREIDAALARIEDGTYGVCEATGRPIGKARLKAQPWVKYCYEYVLAQESGRQSSGL